ncbi:nodulation protein NfeD [Terriglobus aquaticus]
MLHDTIQPVSAGMLQQELDAANARKPDAILVDLSTPGGMEDSARQMVRSIQASRAPVLVFVHEAGTKVAGEGVRVLLAGQAAVMDPGTRLVGLQFAHRASAAVRAAREAESRALQQAVAEALARKGRNADEAVALLSSGVPISPEQAMDAGLLDAVTSRDEVALRAMRPNDPEAAAKLGAAKVVNLPMTPRQHLLRALLNPDLTVLLLTLGALLILLEINTPGTIVPGAAGVLLVLLSLYALLLMPLRWQGVILLVISVGLLLAETQFARGSAYGVAAVGTLTLGLRLLVRGPVPEMEVDWSTSIGAGLGFGGITAGLVLLGVRARRAKVRTGADAMLGWLAVAQTPLEPTGEVLVRGELWRARLSEGNTYLPAGECVKVQSSDGMTLEVAPMGQQLQEMETAQTAL